MCTWSWEYTSGVLSSNMNFMKVLQLGQLLCKNWALKYSQIIGW